MPDFLTIDALSKTYANGFEALKTINLRVEEAEILALLGPNGAGKTTLIYQPHLALRVPKFRPLLPVGL